MEKHLKGGEKRKKQYKGSSRKVEETIGDGGWGEAAAICPANADLSLFFFHFQTELSL